MQNTNPLDLEGQQFAATLDRGCCCCNEESIMTGPQQQQQHEPTAVAAPVAAAAATAGGCQGVRDRCRSNSTGSTVDAEQQETEQQQQRQRQQQQQRQQQEDGLVTAAMIKALQLVPAFLGVDPQAAAAAVAAATADDTSSEQQQQQQQPLHLLVRGELLRGGTTNTIARVSKRDRDSPCCLVRFYGKPNPKP